VILIEQVRDKTRGITLPNDPTKADLWNRENLIFPVSTHPIWLLVSAIAIGLFLVDVAVRRVRIDVLGMFAAVRRAAGKDKKQQAELSGLRAARDKAKASIKTRADTLTPLAAPMVPLEPGVAGAKFDATEEELRAARKDAKSDIPGAAPSDPSKPVTKPKSAKEDAEQGMSALLKAKRRARDEFEDR
jgi:hypothetical protein